MAAPSRHNVDSNDLPSELQDKMTDFDEALTRIEAVLEPLHSVPLSEVHAKVSELEGAGSFIER